jgi:hypothetical protein
MLNVGWWIHSEFKIAHSKFRSPCGVCVSKRSWGVLILDFGFWMLGEEKPNGEFWILNFEWWIEDDVGFWMLDFGFLMEFSIQHSAFKI